MGDTLPILRMGVIMGLVLDLMGEGILGILRTVLAPRERLDVGKNCELPWVVSAQLRVGGSRIDFCAV
jgi:hypothetical protein